DKDLDFGNQVQQFPHLQYNQSEFHYAKQTAPKLTATGKIANEVAIGAALFWAPFFLLAHVIVLILNALGAHITVTGWSGLEQIFTMFGSILYSTLGLYLVYKFSNKWYSRTISLIATLAVLFGFATIHYVMVEPSYAHGLTILTVSLFITFFYNHRRENSLKKWIVLGALTGIMMLSRWQEGFFTLIPLVYFLYDLVKGNEKRWLLIAKGFAYVFVALIVFSPQLYVWGVVYGVSYKLPEGVPLIFDFAHPLLGEFLFSFQHSLLISTPIILISLFGIWFFRRKEPAFAMAVLLALLLNIYVNSSLIELGGNAFGARRMIDCIILFAVFLAALLDRLQHTNWFLPVLCVLAILVVYNLLYMLEYGLNLINRYKPVFPADIINNIPKIIKMGIRAIGINV
ncbi:MAG: glycosyltransferase family 39 protein, partial [Candidatus Woesearchaeota archaeon]|nr:glycosyltransferase family 39 protein [Candidatus Woesearchaeota archaeon]